MFLDAYAEYRNAQGRRTVSIDWTDWLGTGMAFDHDVERDRGFFRSITVEEAILSLAEILDSWSTRVIVGEINYPMLGSVPPEVLTAELSGAPLVLADSLFEAIRASSRGGQSAAPSARPTHDVRLIGREDGTYRAMEEAVARIWARELDLHEINIFERSFDLGGDSLKALRIAQSIQQDLGIRLAMADLFRYLTVADLAEHLDTQRAHG
jgi:acyl carrier protein